MIDAVPSSLDAAQADGEGEGGVDVVDAECDNRTSDGRCICAEYDGTFASVEGRAGTFCCGAADDVPWACVPMLGDSYTYIWQDMSEFGSVCGGRDFPYANALPACPWDEESP